MSVVVAALTEWHEAHGPAVAAARGGSVPAHAYLESYAMLTRLPLPTRLDGRTAHALLAAWFPPTRILEPVAGTAGSLVARMAATGVSGGAAYDALVALTAAAHGEELLTRDRRAESTYRKLGVAHRLLS